MKAMVHEMDEKHQNWDEKTGQTVDEMEGTS